MIKSFDFNSARRLSIAIPETELISCDIPPPELAIVERMKSPENKHSPVNMECFPIDEIDILIDDLERNSNCDTASVASDLTRMCVSDEEEKVMVVLEKTEKNAQSSI